MNVEQVRAWLELLGERGGERSGDWYNTNCPLAPWRHEGGSDRNPSFGIKIEPGESRAWCFSCHWGGSQTALLRELSDLLGDEVHALDIRRAMAMIVDVLEGDEGRDLWAAGDEGPQQDLVFPEDWLARFQPAYRDGVVHAYLEGRRGGPIPYPVVRFLDLRYMHSEDRVCFPIRNRDGDLVGLHGRAVLDEVHPRYRMITYRDRKNPLAWLGESWVNLERPVVFVESVFDLARVYQVYRNVACPLTSSMSVRKVRRMADCRHVVTMFDPDEAGRSARRKVRQVLGNECVVEHVDLVDRDPGDMTAYAVTSVLRGVVDLDRTLL